MKRLVMSTLLLSLLGGMPVHARDVLYGFTPFPYDLSLEAVENTWDFTTEHSTLFAAHMDACVPWNEILAEQPLPQWLLDDWASSRSRIAGRPVYIAITPTKQDRVTAAFACGTNENDAQEPPPEIADVALDDPVVQAAYLEYARRVVEFWEPQFLVLAIEINEMLVQSPATWPSMEALYLATFHEIKKEYPDVQVGIEAVLQDLLDEDNAAAFKRAADVSDFLGLSFYPYGTAYGEFFGVPALPDPPAQWREPLEWVVTWTDTPIGISETGYTTENYDLPVGDDVIAFTGDVELQRQFTQDLVAFSKWAQFLYVIWFVPIDYDALTEAIGEGADSSFPIWEDTGLLDENLKERPAFAEWQKWSDFGVRPELSGPWFNVEQDGHGFVFLFVSWNHLAVYWYVYDADGNQVWLLADGPVVDNVAVMESIVTSGMQFSEFDPGSVNRIMWGTLTIRFISCDQAEISWESILPGFDGGSITVVPIVRVAGLSNCD